MPDDRVVVEARNVQGQVLNYYDLTTEAFDTRLPHEGLFGLVGGRATWRESGTMLITTDFLSGRAAHEATGHPVAVAFEEL